MRQKVVSVLMLLGVVLSIFRCSSSENEESVHEVSAAAVTEVEAVKSSHDKTLFPKSDALIKKEKIEAEKRAALAVITKAKEAKEAKERAEKAKEKARIAAEEAEKAAAEKAAAMKAKAEAKSQADVKMDTLLAENAKMKSSQEMLLSSIDALKAQVTEAEEASLKAKSDAQENLLAKIKEWEDKVSQLEEESKKLKEALAAKEEVVANVESQEDAEVSKLKSALEKLTEEKMGLEEENSEIKSSQELLLAKIEDWEVKAMAAKEESLKTEATREAAAKEEREKLQSALDEAIAEKTRLQTELEAATQANVDLNSSINNTKKALLVKIEEWEKKAFAAESTEKSAFEETVEKYKEVLAKLTHEKLLLEDENSKMKSSQETFLEKISALEVNATNAETETSKLKAALTAALLASKEGESQTKSLGEEVTKLKSELVELTEEKSTLAQANADMNSTMHAKEEELLAKIQEWESKATAAIGTASCTETE